MPDELPHPSPDDIASMLRVGLTDDTPTSEPEEETMPVPDLDATLMVAAPSVTAGGSPSRIWQPPGVEELRKMLPQYEVEAFIARGGMGAVYKGVQTTLKRPVAIKVLPPEADDEALRFAERFKREAQAMARLSHPNIVAVHDAGQTASGLLYFVMEFVEGTDLAQLLAHEGNLPPERAVPIILAVCEALAFAHEEGIIHRDIKPSNVMIDQRGRVKVADFGLAKVIDVQSTMLTRSDVAMGTPDFVAPEALIPGTAVDGRADLYAVGVMLYQMLTGKIPRGRFALPSGVVPKVDKRFDAIVDKAMQTDRDQRYSTASEMKKDMEKVATRLAPSVKTEAADAASSRSSAKKPLLVGIAAIAMFSIAAAWYALNQEPEAAPASALSTDTAASSVSQAAPQTAAEPSKAMTTWAPLPAAVEARGIKLWDAPDKLLKARGITWEDQALRLEQAAAWHDAKESRDAILRASVRANPGAAAVIALRTVSGNPNLVRLSLDAEKQSLALRTSNADRALGEWPLPRKYAPAEWLGLELRTMGEEFSVFVGGKLIGTARSAALNRPGRAMLYAGNGGYFRDITYYPLDGLPEAEALKLVGVSASSTPQVSASSPSLPPAVKLWDSPASLPASSSFRWEDKALCIQDNTLRAPNVQLRDFILRLRVRMNASAHAALCLRLHESAKGRHSYELRVHPGNNALELLYVPDQGGGQTLERWNLLKAHAADDWMPLEVRVLGETIAVMADGSVLGTVRDDRVKNAGTIALRGEKDVRFREIEYVPLDGIPEAEALKLLRVTEATSGYRFPDGPPGFVKELTGHTGEVSGGQSIAILADNRRMFTHAGRVAAGVDVNEAILWDVETGQQVWKRQLTEIKGVIGGSAVLSAVNQVVVIHRGPEFVLEFLDLESGRTIRQVKAEKPLAGTFATHLIAAPDGRRFMMLLYPAKTETGEPLLFQLWDAKAPSSVAQWEFDDGKGCAVHAAAWLDDSRYVVNGHNTTSDRRFHLVLDVNQPGKVRRVVAGNDEVEFSFAPVPGQPDHILTHLRGGGLAFYDLVKSEVVRKFSVPRLQRQLIFLDSQRVLGLSTEWGDALRLWETTSGRLLWEQKDERLCDGLAVSPDRRFAVTNVFVSNGLGQNRPGNKLLVWRLPKADAGPQPGLMTFGGHRYQFVPFMGSWTQAKAKAEAMGGHLATITSAEEHAWFLNNIAQYSEHVWLGGYKTPANEWAWVTGEPWKFTAWARHTDGVMEPMTSGKSPETSNETVLEFGWYGPFEKPGGWNDQADIERHPAESDSGFLVEWDDSVKAP